MIKSLQYNTLATNYKNENNNKIKGTKIIYTFLANVIFDFVVLATLHIIIVDGVKLLKILHN